MNQSPANKYKRLSTEEQEALVIDYKAGMHHRQLGEKYGISRVSARNHTERHGLAKLPRFRWKAINADFFKTLTPESLWVLGWFFSDGNVSKEGHRFSITAHRRDEAVLDRIQRVMGMEVDSIYRGEGRSISQFYGSHPSIHADLISLGCVPAKSLIIKYPTIFTEDWQHWAFLRGVMEGDGHIGLKHKGNRPGFNCDLASGSIEFLESVRNILKTRLDVESIVRVAPVNANKLGFSARLIILGGRDSVLRFLDAIYDNGNANHYLDRKFQTYLEMKEVKDRPKKVTVNRNQFTEAYFLNGTTVYHIRGIAAFAREMAVSESTLWNLTQPVKRIFKPRAHGWTRATAEQIASARACGTLVVKFY